MLYVKLLRTEG